MGFTVPNRFDDGSISYLVCDFHGGSDKVPWTQLREPVWENVDRVDFRIHTFNLGIHLRNLEQLAFFRVSLRWSLC